MNINYPPTIDPLDKALLDQATKLLERTINTTSSGIPAINTTSGTIPTIGTPRDLTATWAMRTGHGPPIYVLTLSDPIGDQVSAQFYPSDLRGPNAAHLPFRMARLWGDLLERHSHKQLEELMKMAGKEN